jgi:hypothetical protein
MEMMTLAGGDALRDAKLELECYWEYACLFPERVLDDFDERIIKLCGKLKEAMVLDMSTISCSFIQCAARLRDVATSVIVGSDIPIRILICNMSSLVLVVGGITVRFVNNELTDLVTRPGFDILPGMEVEFTEFAQATQQGPMAIESVTIDLADLPLRLFFPVSSLALNDSMGRASWDSVTTHWSFLNKLEPFTEFAFSTLITPIMPIVGISAWSGSPLISTHPCHLQVSLDNTTAYALQVTLHFSGTIHDLFVVQVGSATTRLVDYTMIVECPPLAVTLSTVEIVHSGKTFGGDIVLRIEGHSIFTPEEVTILHPHLLSREGTTVATDVSMPLVVPFQISQELTPFPTEAALVPSLSVGRRDLVRYAAFITVTAGISAVVTKWSLRVGGILNFNCVYPQDPKPIEFSVDSIFRFVFEIEAPVDLPNELLGLWQPELTLDWHFPDVITGYSFKQELFPITIFPQSIFVIPNAAPQKLAHASSISWLIWDMDELPHKVLLRIDPGEDYVYMGPKQLPCHLLPKTCTLIEGTLIPLRPGKLKLPTLTVKPIHHGDSIVYETMARPPPFVRP